jgi:small-conductance mechanosensitive channel
MLLLELGQAVWGSTAHAADALAVVAYRLAPADPGPTINTDQVLSFFASKIAPILLGVLGVIFIGRASKGEVSKVLTSSAIAIIGIGFIAGAAALFLVGDSLVRLVFSK